MQLIESGTSLTHTYTHARSLMHLIIFRLLLLSPSPHVSAAFAVSKYYCHKLANNARSNQRNVTIISFFRFY